jgi:hypothetical protein
VSFVVAVWGLRARKDLLVGTGALFVLLALEAYIGDRGTRDSPGPRRGGSCARPLAVIFQPPAAPALGTTKP